MANNKLILVLSGTTNELASSQALTVLTAASFAEVDIIRKLSETSDTVVNCLAPLPKSSSSLNLILQKGVPGNTGEATTLCCLSSLNASLHLVYNLASPSSSLARLSLVEAAQVDGWLNYAWSSLDLTLQVLLRDKTNSQAQQNFESVLTRLDSHLLHRTFMVGNEITLADIRLSVSLHTAIQKDIFAMNGNDKYANLIRWYQTVIHQDAFQQSLASFASGSRTLFTAPKAASALGGTAVLMNGVPPPVHHNKYRRHRIRIKEVLANDATNYLNEKITVSGWARTIRKASSKLTFVELNDGSTGKSLQCVLDSVKTEGFDDCKTNGGTGASFQFEGVIVPSPGEGQLVDMEVTKATLLGAVYGGNAEGTVVGGMLYPLSKKEHTLEHMRDHAHLRPRGQVHAAAMRIRHAMAYATHTFFHNHGFLYIHTPIITGADCEGAGEQFAITSMLGNDHLQPGVTLPVHPPTQELSKSELKRLEKKKAKADPTKPIEEIVPGAVDYTKDFFCQRVNLTVSGQLNVETHACALSDVYTFGPTFRAEESRTYRHLSEFWMIEPEIAFADLSVDIDLAEDYLKYCVQFALENCAEDLEFFEKNPHGEEGLRSRLRNVLDNEFKRLTYTEAIEILQKAVADGVVFETRPEWGIDLPSEHERYICEKVFNKPVVLYNYPKEIKAFYMKVNEDQKTVAAADVLVPKIGEIIGGSQREHRLEVLRQRCIDMKLDPRNVWWYLDLRRYGTIPHAGFGLGFERLILFITGLDNIRDVIPFPRWVGNAKF